ncbi:hypothetical protein [Yoonia sp. SS1-5]|uniref:DUF4350 domain-containing protein n=1 Tax=Yoonia rhodophyticola TaxID=3137370 RepID=A0AAN0MHA6_9RHOB
MGDAKSSVVLFGGIIALLALLIYLVTGASNRALDQSPIGTNGLELWLSDNDLRTIRSHRRVALSESEVALRILPLYDINLDWDVEPPTDRTERRAAETQRDIDRAVVIEKMTYVPTMLVLPKWRTGVIELGLLDEQLLISSAIYRRLIGQFELGDLRLQRTGPKLLTTDDGIVLYQPQLFDERSLGRTCRPYLRVPGGVLIARCDPRDAATVYILSDPDFLNNHGLALGQNAEQALAVVSGIVGDHPGTTLLDVSTQIVLSINEEDARQIRPRTTEDVSRFFSYPFSLIWLGAGFCFVILLWRGLVRFGPPRRVDDGRITASKTASIEAKGYLMRLAGDDLALLREYVADKMTALARDIMGKHAGIAQPRLIRRLHDIAPNATPALENALARLDQMHAGTPAADLDRLAETFEQTHRRIRDELGHVSRRR